MEGCPTVKRYLKERKNKRKECIDGNMKLLVIRC